MIVINNKEISEIVAENKNISFVRYGLILVWEAIKSCFGKGFWVNDKPWVNSDSWRNN